MRALAHWYGWQITLVDVTALGLVGAELAAGEHASPVPGVLALGAYALGGPVVHLAHGRGPAALESFGLRVALPLLGAFVGSAGERCAHACTAGWPTVLGGLVGAAGAMTLDSALLAREPLPIDAGLSFSLTTHAGRLSYSARF